MVGLRNLRQGASKRAKSSEPKSGQRNENYDPEEDDDDDDDDEDASTVSENETSTNADGSRPKSDGSRKTRARTGGTARKRQRRRRRRAHSVSIFSACFSIPNLGSMLPNNPSRSRSILAHLGIGTSNMTSGSSQQQQQQRSGSTSRQQQRPISSSQTAGNLQQVAAAQENVSAPGDPAIRNSSSTDQFQSPSAQQSNRKHVSFGQRNAKLGESDLASQQQQHEFAAAFTNQQSDAIKETGNININTNVIMRNYQAQPQQNAHTSRPAGLEGGR